MGKDIRSISFSPNDERIIFSLSKKNISKIYSARSDRTDFIELSDVGANNFDPVFSPDGTKILFSSSIDKKQSDIALINADGSNKIFLTHGESHDFNPIFSPDGTKIYFIRAEWFGNYSPIALPAWHDMDIYSINVDGTNLTRITKKSYYGLRSLSIHPDNKTLLVNFRDTGNDDVAYSMWTIPIDNPSEIKPVKPNLKELKTWVPFMNLVPIDYSTLNFQKFSKNGEFIVFIRNGELYLMNYETQKVKKIIKTDTETLSVWYPNFSYNNKKIIFIYWDKLCPYRSMNYPILSGSFRERIATINQNGSGFTPIDFLDLPEVNKNFTSGEGRGKVLNLSKNDGR